VRRSALFVRAASADFSTCVHWHFYSRSLAAWLVDLDAGNQINVQQIEGIVVLVQNVENWLQTGARLFYRCEFHFLSCAALWLS
jgi:hypothetical protein